jgi:hypothetical protein
MPVTVPSHKGEGDAGHVVDHNTIDDALTALSASVDDLDARMPAGTITVSDTEPASPSAGDIWFDTSGV